MKARKHIALYYRLLKLCILIMLPMICVTLVFSQYAIDTTVSQQREREMSILSSNLSKLEGEIARVYMVLLDLQENSYEIRDIALRYPSKLSVFEFGQHMNEIRSSLTSVAITSDMVQDITVHWLSLGRATSLLSCYSESFSSPILEYIKRVQQDPTTRMIEGPYGTLTLFTLAKSAAGSSRNFLLYAALKKDEMIRKLLPVDEDSLSMVLGEDWSIIGDEQTTVMQGRYGNETNSVMPQPQWQQMEEQLRSKIMDSESGTIRLKNHLCLYRRSSQWGFIACNLVPLSSVNRGVHVYQLLMCAVVLVTLVLLQLARRMLNRSINKPINALIRLFQQTSKEPTVPDVAQFHDAELNLVYENFWQMRKELQQAQENAVTQGVALEKVKYHLLLAQIDPHFLHNCFNVISTCMHSGDTDTALKMVGYLRQYFRGVTDSANGVAVLKDEWVSVTAYLGIQQIRFGHLLEVSIEPLPEDVWMITVPRLTLQSLVENIFKHAVNRDTGIRRIRLNARIVEDTCLVQVWDNGDSLDEADIAALQRDLRVESFPTEHVGLKNIYHRLKWINEDHDLRLSRPSQGGFMVEVCIKVKEKTE